MSTPASPDTAPAVAPRATVHVARAGAITRITIDRPSRRNAVDLPTLAALRDALQAAAVDDSRVLVLTGAGEAFCAGADLAATSAEEIARFDVTAALRDYNNPVVQAIRAVPKPVIARVHGPAAGVGMNFALACDLIVASEEATFGQVFVKIGLMPDGGSTYTLPRLVGYHKAFELMALGDLVTAREAERLGIVSRVVSAEQLDAAVDEVAQRLARAPRAAITAIKAGLQHGETTDLAGALEFEAVHQDACFHAPDFVEGVTAFLQKRGPRFA
jgi:2-(1,2-epoxy-1,2-dihydrophenyl)acetyl-CoA isomerase